MAPLRLTGSDYRVLGTLRGMVSRGHRRLSHRQTTVAREAGCSERTVRTAYRRLQSWGYFRRTSRPVFGGGRLPDVIEFRLNPNRQKRARNCRFVPFEEQVPFQGSSAFAEAPSGGRCPQRLTGDEIQPCLFPVTANPKPRRPRQPSQSDLDYALWLRIFAEAAGRARVAAGPTAQAEERRHLKVLRERLGSDAKLDAFLREFVGQDDRYLDDRDYPLRYALAQEAYVRLVKAAEIVVAGERAVVPESEADARKALEAAEAAARARNEARAQEAARRKAAQADLIREVEERRRREFLQ